MNNHCDLIRDKISNEISGPMWQHVNRLTDRHLRGHVIRELNDILQSGLVGNAKRVIYTHLLSNYIMNK